MLLGYDNTKRTRPQEEMRKRKRLALQNYSSPKVARNATLGRAACYKC